MQQKVTSRQLQAIYMLIAGKMGSEIAAALGLRRETLWRWKQQPHFIRKYEQVMQDTEAALQRRLMQLGDVSIACIAKTLGDYPYDTKRIELALKVIDTITKRCEMTPKRADLDPNAGEK